jgi:cellulase/cellobiase CelA1
VTYSTSDWNTGFSANVTITNTGTTEINGWTLAYSYSAGQRVSLPGWSATWAQVSGDVTAANLSWNGKLAPNASTGIGVNGTHSGSNPAPASFTLNGSPCTRS